VGQHDGADVDKALAEVVVLEVLVGALRGYCAWLLLALVVVVVAQRSCRPELVGHDLDQLRYLAGLCGLEKAFGASFDAGGPEVMTYREMIERIARLRGRHPLIMEVPVLSPRLSSYWLHLVTPVNAQMTRPLIEGLRNPTVARDNRIRELLPFPLTSFEEAARAALRTRG
jgi:hypothetical protein